MQIKSHKLLIPLTAELTEQPEEVVNDVIMHVYQSLRNWIREPYPYPEFRIMGFGKFRIAPGNMYRFGEYLIAGLRKHEGQKETNPENWKRMVDHFHYWRRMSHVIRTYYKQIKRK